MEWREANAAYQANALAIWHDLDVWRRAWIIATVETINDIGNLPLDGS